MKIYIVRHGETKANEERRWQGWSSDPLNAYGVKLAEETGKALRGIKFDAVYSSPLERAKQTAEILLRETNQNLPIFLDDSIKEVHLGFLEGVHFDPCKTQEEQKWTDIFLGNPIDAPAFPGGESIRGVMERSRQFLRELSTQNYESVLVTTHGGTLRCMLNFLYENPSDFWQGHVPYNCCVNVVEVSNGVFTLTEKDVILYDQSLCVDRFSK